MNQHDATLVASIIQQLAADLFNQPLMSNLTRPLYVERLVTNLLGQRWKFVGDWAGWDIERRDDCKRVEVKQSAARQLFSRDKPSPAIFDIRGRSGYYIENGARWVAAYHY